MLDKMVGMGYSIPSNVAVSGKEKAIGKLCCNGSQSLDFLPGYDFSLCTLPPTGDGLDILKRMLLPDPAARITMEQIQSHPWFTTSLPAQVRHPP